MAAKPINMKHYTIKFKLVEMEPDNYHITIKARIGKIPVNLVIDTGASHTCFDLDFIRSLNQETVIDDNQGMNVGVGSSDFESKISTICDFTIGKLEIPEYQIVLLDLQHINAAYKMMKLPKIHGILGGDIFVRFSAVIDYQKQEMTLWTNN